MKGKSMKGNSLLLNVNSELHSHMSLVKTQVFCLGWRKYVLFFKGYFHHLMSQLNFNATQNMTSSLQLPHCLVEEADIWLQPQFVIIWVFLGGWPHPDTGSCLTVLIIWRKCSQCTHWHNGKWGSGLGAAQHFLLVRCVWPILLLIPSACQLLPCPLTQSLAKPKSSYAIEKPAMGSLRKGGWEPARVRALAELTRPKIKSLKLLFWAKKSLQVVTLVRTNGPSFRPCSKAWE